MNISDLIASLQAALAEHGDLPVVAMYGCGCCQALDDPSPELYETNKYDGWTPGTSTLRLN